VSGRNRRGFSRGRKKKGHRRIRGREEADGSIIESPVIVEAIS